MSDLSLLPDDPVTALGLPPRALNALHGAGIRLLKDAADWSARDLLSLPQMGPATLAAIRLALSVAGLELRPSPRRRRL